MALAALALPLVAALLAVPAPAEVTGPLAPWAEVDSAPGAALVEAEVLARGQEGATADRHGAAEATVRFYAARAFAPAWLAAERPTAQALAVVEVLLGAAMKGLDPEDYGAERLADEVAVVAIQAGLPDPALLARLDAALTRAALRYAGDVRAGRIDPRDLGHDLWRPAPPLDLAALAEALRSAPDAAAALEAVEPAWPQYRALLAALPHHPEAAARIALALEGWRWLPPGPVGPSILVNIPEFRLQALEPTPEGARVALDMAVVVGRADDQFRHTPLLALPLLNLVLRPTWEVPEAIARRDLLPRFRSDATFAARLGYSLAGASGSDLATPAGLDAWRAGAGSLRQAPGPLNALGRALFLFPNGGAVYLHDSPDRGLFQKARRDFSSGCVRVADAPALAYWVLGGTSGWDARRLSTALDGPATRWVRPALRPWVYLVYATASVEPDGELRLHEDLYGHDARLAEALRAASGERATRYQARRLPESRWTKS